MDDDEKLHRKAFYRLDHYMIKPLLIDHPEEEKKLSRWVPLIKKIVDNRMLYPKERKSVRMWKIVEAFERMIADLPDTDKIGSSLSEVYGQALRTMHRGSTAAKHKLLEKGCGRIIRAIESKRYKIAEAPKKEKPSKPKRPMQLSLFKDKELS
jgi:hypothetical protein